jgi:outer membrane protein assembly factor BamB
MDILYGNQYLKNIFMNKILALSIVLAFISTISPAQTSVSGRVADSRNTGISGVSVTDGYNITVTDSEGNFLLVKDKRARFIYISSPDGYDPAKNFYLTAGENKSEFNFKLKKNKGNPGKFIHLGDPEESVYRSYADLLKSYIANNPVSFIILNGDICYEKGMRFHAEEMTSEKLGTRVIYTLGNHDLIDGNYGEEFYEKNFGPVWYSFNSGGVHFVVVPVNYGDRVPSFKPADVYTWVQKDLDLLPKGTPVIYINHHLYGFENRFDFSNDSVQLNLGNYNLKAYLHAHYHTNFKYITPEGVKVISTMSPNKGGIDHSPSSFRVISFDNKGNLNSELRYSPVDKKIAINLGAEKDGWFKVIANIYDTGSDACEASVLNGSASYPLTKLTGWSWQGRVPSSPASMKIKVKFTDGSVILKPVTATKEDSSRIRWCSNAGGNSFMSAPLIAGDLIIATTFDDDNGDRSALSAFDTGTGKMVWRFATANSVKSNPALWEGNIFAIDTEGNIYSIDATSGKLNWKINIRGKGLHPVFTNGLTLSRGIIYAGMGYTLSAINSKDGSVLWSNKAWNGGVNTVAAPVVDPGTNVLLSSAYWLGRFAHNTSDGSLIWQKKDNDTRICDNTPVVADGKFYYCSPEFITVTDPLTGNEEVKHKITYTINTNSRPLINGRYFIVGTADKGIAAFDRYDSFKELWNFKTAPAILYTAPYTKDYQMTVESGAASRGEYLYFGANDGYLYCVNISNGLYRWKLNIGAPITGDITINGDKLYCCDFGGNLWCINLD